MAQHRDKLEMLVERLLEAETMDGRDVEELVKQSQNPRDEEVIEDVRNTSSVNDE
jgi:ATP-dependent Zn protease